MTSRLPSASLDYSRYDTLVAEAMTAFSKDIMYAVQVAESARSLAKKQSKKTKRS